jgi:oxygen-dependent protoporphyrinogen oxidase
VEALRLQLPAARVRLGARVRRLRAESGGFGITLPDGSTLSARSVVVAVPAYAAAPLLSGISPEAGLLLQTLPFASSATVALGYRRDDVAHRLDGYGMIVPRREGLRTSACSFVSSKFPGRAPEGHVLLRAFLGGARDPDLLQLSDAEIGALARREMRGVLGLRGEPVLERIYRWPRATPQMVVGHLERMNRLDRIVDCLPGLFLTGAGIHGTGLPDAIADGARAAGAAAGYVVAAPPSRFIQSARCPAAS